MKELYFCEDKLIVFDNRNDVTIFNLDSKKRAVSFTSPGQATAIVCDPTLDYCLIGLQNGDVVAYDMDREGMTQFRIPNLWREKDSRARLTAVVSLQFHPKDVGTLLVGYSGGAAIYSFKQNKILKFFQYEIPRGTSGGSSDPRMMAHTRTSRLTHAAWHPTGTFVLTAHDDGSLAFWDPRDGRMIEARTIEDGAIHQPQSVNVQPGNLIGAPRHQFHKIAWCSKSNPDDTGILLVGGNPTTSPSMSLTFIDLGPTPNYQTSSWDLLTHHFRSPKRVHILPTPSGAQVSTLVLIPRSSPHYAGSHDPIALVIALTSGELATMSFPTGHPINPINQLHVSLSLVHPFITRLSVADVDRARWLGMRESRQQGPSFLLGGAEARRPTKRVESCNIALTAHADGSIRVWDAGHGAEIENGHVLQADLARALNRWEDLDVAKMTMSGATGELAVAMQSGELLVFRLNRNPSFGRATPSTSLNEGPGHLTDITHRADPSLKEGLVPLTLLDDQQGQPTALSLSKVGFVAVGYQSGGISVIDLRGPAIIHTVLISHLEGRKSGITGAIKGKRASVNTTHEWATAIEFGVMTLDEDNYSSIAMFVGTNCGRVLTFKILPSQSGRYSVQFAGQHTIADNRIVSLQSINAENGMSAEATGQLVMGLQSGAKVSGVVIAITISSAHIFKPASSKGASRNFDNVFCDVAAVSRFEHRGCALVGLFGDGTARAYSIPALRELGVIRLGHIFDVKRFSESSITAAGEIIGWTGPSELAMVSVWGTGVALPPASDKLWDPAKIPPPRPTISNLQWIAGTQYVTPADMDVLIGGPDRPPSKKMLTEERAQREAEYQRQREAARTGRPVAPAQEQEGYWAYMQRQIQERTENLGLASDSMDRTAEASESWSKDVSSFIAKQKRQAALGLIGSKFGL